MNANSLARQFAGMGLAKDVAKSAAKTCSEKCGDKRSEKRGENFYRRKTAVWDLSRLFSFRSRDLVGNPLSRPLSPEIWQCRRLSLSTVQPIVERNAAEVLQDFIHSILGAALTKAGTYHDMRQICCRSVWETFTRVTLCPSKSRGWTQLFAFLSTTLHITNLKKTQK